MVNLNAKLAAGLALVALTGAPALSQTATKGPTVFDSAGREVGQLVGESKALIKYANGEILMDINVEGFGRPRLFGKAPFDWFTSRPTTVFYTTNNCSGPAYFSVKNFPDFGFFIASAAPVAGSSPNGTIHYAARPFTTVTVASAKDLALSPAACQSGFTPSQIRAGVLTSVATAGFKLPFVIK